MTNEALVKQQVKELLELLGAYQFMPVQRGMGKKTVDFLCCIQGEFVAIETKRPGKSPTKLQSLIMEEIKLAGGIAVWGASIWEILNKLRAYYSVSISATVQDKWRRQYEDARYRANRRR